MSKNERHDPFVGYAFRVEIDGIVRFGFQEVSGLSNQTDIFEYQEGGENHYTHKLVGQTTFSNIVLKVGIAPQSVEFLSQWRKLVIDGDINSAKKSGTISLFNKKGDYKKSWTFNKAWPCKVEIQPLNAQANSVAIYVLELAVESVEESL